MDLMEKTGVYFPEAHTDSIKMARLAAAGLTEIGFDNIMPLFGVWHESSALGCNVNWGEISIMPNCREELYEIGDEIKIPDDLLLRQGCRVPLEALKILKKEYGKEAAIVGKVFGPWTLGYHMFGVEKFLINTILDPDAVKKAIETLLKVTIAFGNAQIEAGVDALCFADHATRDLCSPQAYREFLMEIHTEIKKKLKCPLILHICGDTSDRIPFIRETGIDCFHFDSKVPSKLARELAGEKLALMGGTSNFSIIRSGVPDLICKDAAEKIQNGIDIIGPECAVPLDAPYENMKILAREVKKY
jgi:[methyl-Co(III) methanol-specific corrinoid protein]:coenzyme M methyltransferase